MIPIRNRKIRLLISLLTIPLPWRLKRKFLIILLGYQLDPTSRIGYSLIIAQSVRLEEGARIGHLTICRDLKILEMKNNSSIGNLNWITGGSRRLSSQTADYTGSGPMLRVGGHSAITHRHYIDCSAHIVIGDYTTVAGVRSQFFTHSINLRASRQQVKPIIVGDYCFIGTGCILLPGARLPDFSILAAGSLLQKEMDSSWTLYAGVPAIAKKKLPSDYAYFYREVGFVE